LFRKSIPARAIEDPDIRAVLKESLAESIAPERPGPEEIPGLVRDCVDELEVLPAVELFGDRREAFHAALTDLLRWSFFERAGSRRSDRHASPRWSGSVVVDLCVDLLGTGEFAEISATEDVVAGAFRRALRRSCSTSSWSPRSTPWRSSRCRSTRWSTRCRTCCVASSTGYEEAELALPRGRARDHPPSRPNPPQADGASRWTVESVGRTHTGPVRPPADEPEKNLLISLRRGAPGEV
jgi:hypothetical protein